MYKLYLGDGVYVEFDNGDIVLTTEDGIAVTNRIVLEPGVLVALGVWIRRGLPPEFATLLTGRINGDS